MFATSDLKKPHRNKWEESLIITPELLERFDFSGPRYTSYPTADRFVEAFNDDHYKLALDQRQIGGMALPLSIYVHIPFCESLCFFCGCNKIVTKRHERSAEYLKYLRKEINLYSKHFGTKQSVKQLHLGGGSPTFFTDQELTELMVLIRSSFNLSPEGEYSIEVDPRTVNASRLRYIASLGFNRISFGVQDFNPDVQKAVHRVQPAEDVFALVKAARRYKFESINVDLIYGLPKQTVESFTKTLNEVVRLRPDRIALYAYAHLPERFKPQRSILKSDLPIGSDKILMLDKAISIFLNAGYVNIGMDHFALPTDSLAIVKRQGRLHRNFQGYSIQPESDLIGLGVSAIGKVGATYSQNAKTLSEYYGYLDQKRFPVVRGLALTRDDLLRRTVIMAIMCQGEVDFESIELAFMVDFKEYFSDVLNDLEEFQTLGLLHMDDHGLQVSTKGWFFVRAIAMVFDRYLQVDQNRTRFSKII